MIEIKYKEESYYYEGVGGQAYDVDMEIKLKEDASIKDVVDAMVRILQGARYRVTKTAMLNAVKDVFEEREEY